MLKVSRISVLICIYFSITFMTEFSSSFNCLKFVHFKELNAYAACLDRDKFVANRLSFWNAARYRIGFFQCDPGEFCSIQGTHHPCTTNKRMRVSCAFGTERAKKEKFLPKNDSIAKTKYVSLCNICQYEYQYDTWGGMICLSRTTYKHCVVPKNGKPRINRDVYFLDERDCPKGTVCGRDLQCMDEKRIKPYCDVPKSTTSTAAPSTLKPTTKIVTTVTPSTSSGPTLYPRLPLRLQNLVNHQKKILNERNSVKIWNPMYDCFN